MGFGLFFTKWLFRYLNTTILITLVIISCTTLFFKVINYCRKENTTLYKPINQKTAFYGATETSTSSNDEGNDDVSSANTIIPTELSMSEPWLAYNWTRLFMSGIQLGLLVYMALSLDESNIDIIVEGRLSDLIHMYYARIAFWVCIILIYFSYNSRN